MSTVVRLPTPTNTPDPSQRQSLSVMEIDAALAAYGDFGREGWEVHNWAADHPITSSEGDNIFANLRDAHEEDVPEAAERARDATSMFLQQSQAFAAASKAIVARDASLLPAPRPGNAASEVHRILDGARELLAPDGLETPDGRTNINAELETLALLFGEASKASMAWAMVLTELRDQRDGRRLARRLLKIASEHENAKHQEEV